LLPLVARKRYAEVEDVEEATSRPRQQRPGVERMARAAAVLALLSVLRHPLRAFWLVGLALLALPVLLLVTPIIGLRYTAIGLAALGAAGGVWGLMGRVRQKYGSRLPWLVSFRIGLTILVLSSLFLGVRLIMSTSSTDIAAAGSSTVTAAPAQPQTVATTPSVTATAGQANAMATQPGSTMTQTQTVATPQPSLATANIDSSLVLIVLIALAFAASRYGIAEPMQKLRAQLQRLGNSPARVTAIVLGGLFALTFCQQQGIVLVASDTANTPATSQTNQPVSTAPVVANSKPTSGNEVNLDEWSQAAKPAPQPGDSAAAPVTTAPASP
jgi:hypothetical protein